MKVTKDRLPQVRAAIKALTKDRILVGIPAEKANRKPEPNEPRPEISNAQIGYLSEFGMSELNLPPRPHLVPGVRRILAKAEALFEKAADKAIDGDLAGVRQIENQIGFLATSSVKSLISDGLSPPLSERTLAERKRRGVTRTKPLQDTGQYRNNIDFVVRPAKGVKRTGQ